MERPLSPDEILAKPELVSRTVRTCTGQEVLIRLIRSDDGEILGRYLTELSEQAQGQLPPHRLDRAAADAVCADAGNPHTLRTLAIVQDKAGQRVVGYFILQLSISGAERARFASYRLALDDRTDCKLSVSMAEKYRHRGVGRSMMLHVLELARRLGRRRVFLTSGTQASYVHAIHFYTSFGFRVVGQFTTGHGETEVDNFDMILDL